MKNLFKCMGLALIAGAMFASCTGGVEVIANANDATLGSVTGGGKYEAGTEVVLTAVPADGAAFVDWSDGNTDNPRTIIVPAEGPVTYTANFAANGCTVAVTGALTADWKATSCLGSDYSSYSLFYFGAFKNYDSAAEPYVQGYLPSNVGTYTHAAGSDYYYMFYYENEDDVTTEDDSTYPNWQPSAGMKETLTALDLTAGTVSATVDGDLFYLPDYEAGTTTEAHININAVNAAWEASGKAMKKMGKLYTK